MKHTAYVSHSPDSRGMLAVWIDHRPSCDKNQRDPDGWVTGVSGTEYEERRLVELTKAPAADIVRLHGAPAEWWSRIDGQRKRAASKARNAQMRDAQTLIPIAPEVEQRGRDAAFERGKS